MNVQHGYPQSLVAINHIEPAPRRIRGYVGGTLVFDTTRAIYLWEWPPYPQYYIPIADVRADLLVDERHSERLSRGSAARFGLQVGPAARPAALRVYQDDALAGLPGMARFEWDALDAWFEEDEQIFVHPRSPYARVDAVRSTRKVRIEIGGLLMAESSSPVMVFETGLPPRTYLNRTDVNIDLLEASDTRTACPYKGVTSGYWSLRVGDVLHEDLAWTYDFPTRQLQPIAGLIAFYDEKVDTYLDGQLQARPRTHFVA
jgi:uncharacterized protein (DUF427 family)